MALPTFKTEHFKIYHVRGHHPPRRMPIALKGQFESRTTRPRRHYAIQLSHFCNPVSKNGKRVANRKTHLSWYTLAGSREAVRTVVIENQFGREVLVLGEPRLLLAPAIKQGREAPKRVRLPTDVSHFKGYRVLRYRYHKIVSVRLKDQFDRRPVTTRVYPPAYFCVPVEKWVGRRRHPLRNPREHLTIYPIMPRWYREVRGVWDQFKGDHLHNFYARALAVPTLKRQFKARYVEIE